MLLKRLKRTAVVLVALGCLAGGAGWLARPAGGPALHAQTPEIQDKVNTRLDFQRLQGTWRPVAVLSAEEGAEDRALLKRTHLVIKGNDFRVLTTFALELPPKQHLDVVVMKGRVEIDPNKTPKAMDWVVQSPDLARPILKVYQVEGDRLKIVTGRANKRPSSLQPDPENATTILYERVKIGPTGQKPTAEAELEFRLRTDGPLLDRNLKPAGEEPKDGKEAGAWGPHLGLYRPDKRLIAAQKKDTTGEERATLHKARARGLAKAQLKAAVEARLKQFMESTDDKGEREALDRIGRAVLWYRDSRWLIDLLSVEEEAVPFPAERPPGAKKK